MINVARLFENEAVAMVLHHMGYDKTSDPEDVAMTIETIQHHGMTCGVGGFIYYSETCEFFDLHKEFIAEYLSDAYTSAELFSNMTEYDILTHSDQFKNDMTWIFVETAMSTVDLDDCE